MLTNSVVERIAEVRLHQVAYQAAAGPFVIDLAAWSGGGFRRAERPHPPPPPAPDFPSLSLQRTRHRSEQFRVLQRASEVKSAGNGAPRQFFNLHSLCNL